MDLGIGHKHDPMVFANVTFNDNSMTVEMSVTTEFTEGERTMSFMNLLILADTIIADAVKGKPMHAVAKQLLRWKAGEDMRTAETASIP